MTFDFDYATYHNLSSDERDRRYPLTKALINGKGGRERLWIRTIAPGVAMLDNDPLDPNYRYADVVAVTNGTVGAVLRRSFPLRYGFRYRHHEKEAVDVTRRAAIAARIDSLGAKASGSFWMPGMGFLVSAEGTEDAVVEALTFGPVYEIAQLDPGPTAIIWSNPDLEYTDGTP